MAIDIHVANEIAQQLMREIVEMQDALNAETGTWISALMQLTASFVVNSDPLSTPTIVRVFGLYVDRAQQVKAAQRGAGFPPAGPAEASRDP